MKTIAIMVSSESASWSDGGPELLEGIFLGKPQIMPCLTLEQKMEFAKKVLGNTRKPRQFEDSTVIGDGDLAAIQFFDVEESTEEQAVEDLGSQYQTETEEDEG